MGAVEWAGRVEGQGREGRGAGQQEQRVLRPGVQTTVHVYGGGRNSEPLP